MSKKKSNKGILVDPDKRTVELIDVPNSLDGIYDAIGCKPSPFTCVRVDERNVIYADDEAMFKEPQHFTRWHGYHYPIANKFVILGVNELGNTVDTDLTTVKVMDSITFVKKKVLGFTQHVEDATIMGKPGKRIVHRTIYDEG